MERDSRKPGAKSHEEVETPLSKEEAANLAEEWARLTTEYRGLKERARAKGSDEAWQRFLVDTAAMKARIDELEKRGVRLIQGSVEPYDDVHV